MMLNEARERLADASVTMVDVVIREGIVEKPAGNIDAEDLRWLT